MTVFFFHFLILNYSGNGDGFFSSEFQSTLVGNELYEHTVPECKYLSTVCITRGSVESNGKDQTCLCFMFDTTEWKTYSGTVEPQLYRPYGTSTSLYNIQWNRYTDPMGPALVCIIYSGTSVIQTLWDWH